MTQTDGLIDLGALVEGERRWFSLGQNLDLDHLDLDLARSEITVAVSSGRRRTSPVIFTTYSLRRSWLELMTHCTTPVRSRRSMKREVLAVLATAVDPAAHGDRPAGVGSRQLAAHVGAHRGGVILHVLVIPDRWEKGC